MSTLFGLRKSRLRQSSVSGQDLTERSVPYDMTIASRSPIAIGTLSQGNPGISAPNTNPALTSVTDFNKFTALKQHRDNSPNRASTSTADSSTLFDEPSGPLTSPNLTPIPHPQTTRLRRNEPPSMRNQGQDFGQISSTQGSPRSVRPSSGMTIKSDTSRNSTKYADPSHSHLPFHLHHRQTSEPFHFPRPKNEEIEILFEKVKQTRGDPKGLDKFTIDQKWELVKNDEQIRWNEQRIGEQSRKLHETGQSLLPQSPEWYIHKFMNRTITAKQASDLLVCLRSKEVR
jgi:cytokinesis protein